MHPLRSLRTPSTWLRALLVALTLGFALNSIAHAGHVHDATHAPTHQLACGHCVHFGALAGTPSNYVVAAPLGLSHSTPVLTAAAVLTRAPELSARPRGPPAIAKLVRLITA